MLRLVLFRHGRAVPHDQGPDSARSLTETGRRESVEMAKALDGGGIAPDLVLVSPAARTRETWDSAKSIFPTCETRFERELYLATPETILSLIHAIEEGPKIVMIVGHNPALHDLALDFLASATVTLLRAYVMNFPRRAALFLISMFDHGPNLQPIKDGLTAFLFPFGE